MKLGLVQEKGFPLLVVSGPIDQRQFDVLKAGIRKLLANGKNRMMVEFSDLKSVDSTLLREIAMLNVLARELSGNIVLSGVDAETQKKILNHSKPPVVECFSSRDQAVEALSRGGIDESATAVPLAPPAGASTGKAAAAATEANEEKAKLFKADIRDKELNSVGSLRKEIEELKNKNVELEKQLMRLVTVRREPADTKAAQEKIKTLEAQLEDALEQVKDAQAPGAKK